MSDRTDADVALYELTVSGRIGPAVQAVLEQTAHASHELLTILVGRLGDDEGLVDLLTRFESRGLEITSIAPLV